MCSFLSFPELQLSWVLLLCGTTAWCEAGWKGCSESWPRLAPHISTAVEDQYPHLFLHGPQHCRVRVVTQGPVPRSMRLQPPVPNQSWGPAALTLPGLGMMLSPLLSRFLFGTRAGEPGHRSLSAGEEELLLHREPCPLIAWGAVSWSRMGHICLLPLRHQPQMLQMRLCCPQRGRAHLSPQEGTHQH